MAYLPEAAPDAPPAKRGSKAQARHAASVDASEGWPPLAQCVRENMRAFPGCMLLTRVGGFYESYFDQAPTLASKISIKLAARRWNNQTVPMAGFPIHQLEKYLKVLVQDHGMLVAICEEFQQPSAADNSNVAFDRRVTRVVSPGTLIDERFLDPFTHNYILAISRSAGSYGLAWLDVSTADFATVNCQDDKSLRDEVARVRPREVVIQEGSFDIVDGERHIVWDTIENCGAVVSRVSGGDDTLLQGSPNASRVERDAISMLTAYLRTRLMEHMPDMRVDARPADSHVMRLDAHTLGALEVRETMRERSARGSLTSTIRRTVTHGGARLLQEWLTQPSMSVSLIRARHAIVELFLSQQHLRHDLRVILRHGAGDVLRTMQRIALRRGDIQDMLEIRDFAGTVDRVMALLRQDMKSGPGWDELADLTDKFQSISGLCERLSEAIDERVIEKRLQRQEALLQSADDALAGGALVGSEETPRKRVPKKGPASLVIEEPLWGDDIEHLIRPSAASTLKTSTNEHTKLRREARQLENALRSSIGDAVTLRFLLGQGHVVHVPSTHKELPESFLEHATLSYKTKTTRTFYLAEWTRIGQRMQKLEASIAKKEGEYLRLLRDQVIAHAPVIRRNARLLEQLDVLLGFAQAAEELRLVRPVVDESACLEIRGGRHLGVELGLLEQHRMFTKNDVKFSEPERMHLVTGPNMGGKSTFLRQTAIIAILAQAGSFVPADAAHIGLVDRVFSRVGAKDDLFHSRSTFMVEMMETSEILRRATSRSLVIADEIGRGTNTSVGLSIAYATLHTLACKNKCRTLFATHYHELADMLGYSSDNTALDGAVAFYCTTLETLPGGHVHYAHQVRPGVNRESHGLQVAQLADMPPETVALAEHTHKWLLRHESARLSQVPFISHTEYQ
ncbi:hypothetical protein MCUN1_000717 [Malassezia cuniculi]|uniref:DNA mismatch repair proteins mutS family domain-containing protein n=1 Tax=Malassezia cuniculi TaxID=948313 RepID=A0AAF0ENY4_9BASI|nr:hypothetical protein MCUN1_000717 [Malassezia cuniculi]